jgi:c-di-AMP phosphodiesterase-like protein
VALYNAYQGERTPKKNSEVGNELTNMPPLFLIQQFFTIQQPVKMKQTIFTAIALLFLAFTATAQTYIGYEYAEISEHDRHYHAYYKLTTTKDSAVVELLTPIIIVTQHNEFTNQTDTVVLEEKTGVILSIPKKKIKPMGQTGNEYGFIYKDKKSKKIFLFLCRKENNF